MPTRKVGTDARGRRVSVGDRVINKKGQVLEITQTEKSFRSKGIVRARPLKNGGSIYVELRRIFRVRHSSTTSTRRRWRKLYDTYVRPARRRAIHQRHKVEAQTYKWPCPVCKNGKQPTRFKIGILVWSGKQLRVCSTPCKRKVLREVRKHEGKDRELIRRRVAWQYMKMGGQV